MVKTSNIFIDLGISIVAKLLNVIVEARVCWSILKLGFFNYGLQSSSQFLDFGHCRVFIKAVLFSVAKELGNIVIFLKNLRF